MNSPGPNASVSVSPRAAAYNPALNKVKKAKETKNAEKEFYKLDAEYGQVIKERHNCLINEIRVDANDGLRAQIVENIFYDIQKNFKPFVTDIFN
jgi:hypothetical protein